jgi:acetyl-CoA carboxylase carboxyl transferase subunit beta
MSDSRFKRSLVPPTDAPSGAKLPGGDTSALRKPKLSDTPRRRSIPEGLWTKCPQCGAMLHDKDLEGNLAVCPSCQHHFPIKARARIASLTDPASFEELDAGMSSVDILKFTGVATYVDRLAKYQKSTGLRDAVVSGVGRLAGRPLGLAVMEFSFLGGSMGSVVGEKITRCIETATERRLGMVIVSSSGGARMYEGMFSLMQMAKTSAALAYHRRAGLPFISVLTNPTTAGVMASYASLGDLIIAEPGAMIGFAGPRVIKDTTQATLPPGFQTAEFLQEHGLIDSIVPRSQLRQRLALHLDFLGAATAPAEAPKASDPASSPL